MEIKLKRSSKDQAPTTDQIDVGELALSYNAANPKIYIKNSDGNIVPIFSGNIDTNSATIGELTVTGSLDAAVYDLEALPALPE